MAPMAKPAHFSGRSEVRWGILGCGDVTEIKSGPGFQKATGSRLVAVMRRNADLAADYARRHGVGRWYNDAAALIADPEVDAVYIATLPGTHASYALQVAAAGKPAYVEKPMARTTGECDRMVEGFALAELPLFVAYYRRRLPRFLAVEEILKGGRIGTVTGISYRLAAPHHQAAAGWRLDAESAGGGHFLDVGSHALDLLDFWFGPLQQVAGNAANLGSPYEVEDAVTLTFLTEKGIPGAMACDFASAVKDDSLRIAGTLGEVSLSVYGNEPVRLETGAGVELLERPNPPHVAQPLIQSVVDDLLGRGTCPSTGESGRRTTRVMDQVLDSFYGRRDDDFWARPDSWRKRGA
jgi:1,5-anhydro-D-fructose reductase (1,5-anhydro-D-mannitol-forming)